MITPLYSSTILLFIMSSIVVQLFLLAFISIVTADEVTQTINRYIADPGQFPFLASIRIKGVHICGGSIVNSLFILTAGHCVKVAQQAKINDVTVVTGSVQLSKDGYTSYVANMIPAGDGEDYNTDIGLIKLTMPLVYNSNTTRIKYSNSINDLPNEVYGTVIGWGSTNSNVNTASDRLQYTVAFITDANCIAFSKKDKVICTNSGPTYGVCYGDSGSPLIYKDKIFGVVSRAVLCAKGFPDVYSTPAHNINFIRHTMNTA